MLAICTARNEVDIIGLAVKAILAQGARVVVADNLSTDDTADIVRALGAEVVTDDNPAHCHGKKMTALAASYAESDEWVIPFDADEVWTGLAKLAGAEADIAPAAPHVHVNRERRALMNEPQPKVAFRWRPEATICEGNHWVENVGSRIEYGLINVCHHQYRTLDQVRRKVREGARAIELAADRNTYGAHWRELAALSDDELAEWWTTYQDQATIPCRLSAL